ncbi:kinase-like domain-containing protein [Sporodiniella umbellata]|nr:kinase-like domain-containing protein [Sporodiniella umbellata]
MGVVCGCYESNINFDEEVELRHFYLLRAIGKGAFGKVRIVQHKQNLVQYALKYMNKLKSLESNAFHNILTERNLLERIDHPLIVNLRYAFHDHENLFMVMDLMLGGDLRFQLDLHGRFNELQVRFYIAELILAIGYIHQNNIIHRDIKPENILLNAKGHAHLHDFNIATYLSSERPYRTSRAGSLPYMAPEILSGQPYTTSVDWWSLGIVLYELLFGKRPFEGSTQAAMERSICKSELNYPQEVPISLDCRHIIEGLLTKDPESRLGHGKQGLERLKKQSWFQGLDWEEMKAKESQPPYIPNNDTPNYDAVHELEELLCDEDPLRPHSKSKVANMQELMEIDSHFLPYDYTSQKKKESFVSRIEDSLQQKIDEAKYKSKNYQRLS